MTLATLKTLSPEKQRLFDVLRERNTPERILAFMEKMEAGLQMVGNERNPAWENAFFEHDILWMHGKPPQGFVKDPFPYRYNDAEAGQRHAQTGRQQPECVPVFLTVWSDGSKTEALWDDPFEHLHI